MTRSIQGIKRGIIAFDFFQSFLQISMECILGVIRLEGARKCGGWLGVWVCVWALWWWAGRLAGHGGFQFEYSVKEHTLKDN
jgi:hypothetical protein